MFNWHAVASRAQLDLGVAAARKRHQEEFLKSFAKPPLPPDARKLRSSSSNNSTSSDAEPQELDDEVHSESGSDSEVSLVLSESTEDLGDLQSRQEELLEAEIENIVSPRDVLIADLQMKCALLETEGFQLREKVLQLEAERERDRAMAAAATAARGMGSPVSSSQSSSPPACSPCSCVLLSEVAEAGDTAEDKSDWLAEAELSGPEGSKHFAEVEEGSAEFRDAADLDPSVAGQAELSGASVFLISEVDLCPAAEPEPAKENCEAVGSESCREPGAKCCGALEAALLGEAEAENHELLETGLVLSTKPCEAVGVAATIKTPPVEKQSLLSDCPPAMERSRPSLKHRSVTGSCKLEGAGDTTSFPSECEIPVCPAGHGPLSLVPSSVPWICDTCDHFYKYSNHGFVEPRYHCSYFGCNFANSCNECAFLNTAAWYGTKDCPPHLDTDSSEASSGALRASESCVSSDRMSDPESPRGLPPLPHVLDGNLVETVTAEDATPSATESAPAKLSSSYSPIRQVSGRVDMHGDFGNPSGMSQAPTSARSICSQSSTFGCSQPATPRSGVVAQIVRQKSIRMPATHESYQFAFNQLALPLMKVDIGSAYASFEAVNTLFTKINGVPCGSSLYNMACCLSMGSSENPAVPGAAGLPPHFPVDDIVSARLELAALLLRSAVGAGYTDMLHMVNDPDLQTLRNKRPTLLATFWQHFEAQKATPRPTTTCARANALSQAEARAVLA